MLKGIDINSNNWVSDWNKVKEAGIQVVINKATEGNYYKDKYLSYRVNECKELGIKIGAYHFAGNQDVTAEVDAFIAYTKDYSLDTIPWLDIEQPPSSYSWKWEGSNPTNFVSRFVSLYKQKTGKDIGVYTNKYFYETFLKGKIDSNIKLWIASYGVSNSPYAGVSWQYSETGSVLGIDGNVDMDWFAEDISLSENSEKVENNSSSGVNKTIKNMVCVNNSVDERAGKYLADFLQCPIVDNSLVKFDYSIVENVYGVGGGEFCSYVKKIIKGEDRYETNQAVLDFIKNEGK